MRMLILGAAGLILSYILSPFPAIASEETGAIPDDLTELSIEELLNISVTSVSRKPQKLSDAVAAVFVITQEDIRRSGATSIPELLRMVPGLEVGRLDANKWAVTSRGFSGRFANKLLVLFDGRSVYTPLFSGVYWDRQNYILEDIERIEVIRGPGASLWGANAVNGVINITTKRARDSQGGLVTGGYGAHQEGFGGARFGGKIDADTWYRVYSKYYHHGGFGADLGGSGADWEYFINGFRVDRDVTERDSVTFQGDVLQRANDETYSIPSITSPPLSEQLDSEVDFSGGNLLFRWNHTLSSSSNTVFQSYYDGGRNDDDLLLSEDHNTFDLDFQHQFRPAERHSIIWGLGYRFSRSDIDDTDVIQSDADCFKDHLFSAFLQDEIALVEGRLNLTLGSKLEHNDYTGFEVQPNVRLLWTPHKDHALWASASRAVRTPSWSEEDIRYSIGAFPPNSLSSLPTLISLTGENGFGSEEVQAFELGYRLQLSPDLSLDIAAFFNIYDDLRSLEAGVTTLELTPVPYLSLPYHVGNKLDGETYGVEVAADWQFTRWWRLQPAYTFIQMDLHTDNDSSDSISEFTIEGTTPGHQLSLRSWMELPHSVQVDLWVRIVDDLPAIDVDGYTTLDARLGWRPKKNIEFSIVGQNLLDSGHIEGVPDFLGTEVNEIERTIYGKFVYRF
jgi:iron complex outermembrane receptor protein